MASSRRKIKVQESKEPLPLETSPWILLYLRRPRSELSDTMQTFGFVRYERPELRMNIEPFDPDPMERVMKLIAKRHMREEIVEGIFTMDDLGHPTGESWRFLARKCNQAGLLAASEFYLEYYVKLGSPQSDDYYRLGILDIVMSDADNLLPGESGYNTRIDGTIETIVIH